MAHPLRFCLRRWRCHRLLIDGKKPPSGRIAVLVGSLWLRVQDLNLAAHPNKITFHRLRSSITRTRSEARPPRTYAPTPRPKSIQIQQPAPVTPGSASKRREPRSLNRETLSPDHGSRSVDHGPMCLDLGPRTVVQGSGKVAGKVLAVYLQRRFANLLI